MMGPGKAGWMGGGKEKRGEGRAAAGMVMTVLSSLGFCCCCCCRISEGNEYHTRYHTARFLQSCEPRGERPGMMDRWQTTATPLFRLAIRGCLLLLLLEQLRKGLVRVRGGLRVLQLPAVSRDVFSFDGTGSMEQAVTEDVGLLIEKCHESRPSLGVDEARVGVAKIEDWDVVGMAMCKSHPADQTWQFRPSLTVFSCSSLLPSVCFVSLVPSRAAIPRRCCGSMSNG
ncbi:hypothetical protein QBC39DRAFT_335968 [Podospora conica]|nr:hypothetical protein QBC39DRAFT_335968 [Schizothecium conicum]